MENLHAPGLESSLSPSTALLEGIASLSRGAYIREASLGMMLSILAESAAQMSGIERVSIWALTDDHQELRCLERYERTPNRHSQEGVRSAVRHPRYFEALRAGNCIAADHACLHPDTAEFANEYLLPNRVTAVLDTPIHSRGELQGVLCFEQVGMCQSWTAAQRIFGQAVANLVTLALVEYEAEEARRQAQAAHDRLREVCAPSQWARLAGEPPAVSGALPVMPYPAQS